VVAERAGVRMLPDLFLRARIRVRQSTRSSL
jgi:hypothetical protein